LEACFSCAGKYVQYDQPIEIKMVGTTFETSPSGLGINQRAELREITSSSRTEVALALNYGTRQSRRVQIPSRGDQQA
jgi:hypothetical protein